MPNKNTSPSYPGVPPQTDAKASLVAPQYGFPTGFKQMAYGSSDIYGKTFAIARTSQFQVKRLQSTVTTQYRSGSPVPTAPRPTSNASTSIPYVSNVSASVSSATYGGAGYAKLVVTFAAPADQRNWKYARLYVKNFQGNPNYVMMGESTQSPLTVLLQATGETIVIAVGSRSPFGEVNDYTKAPGTSIVLTTGGGSSGVTSVALTMPSEFTVTGSPITSSGTLAVTKANESANLVFSGPSTGAAAAPTFRSLVAADLPNTAVTPGSYTLASLTVDAQGRLTAASSGAGGSGAWTNITGSVTVTGATVSGGVATVVTPGTTITFSSIPGTYNHLVLEILARVSDSALVENFNITFNSDTGANYDKQLVAGNNATASASATSGASNLLFGFASGATATASAAGQNQLRINNYAATNFFKMANMLSEVFETTGTTSTYRTGVFSGMWRSTAAITRIDVVDGGGGNFAAGSAFSLYGIT